MTRQELIEVVINAIKHAKINAVTFSGLLSKDGQDNTEFNAQDIMTAIDQYTEYIIGESFLPVCLTYPDQYSTRCNNCIACKIRDNSDFNNGYEYKYDEVLERAGLSDTKEKTE